MSLIISRNKVSYEQLANVQLPAKTDTHQPVAHSVLVDLTREALDRVGLEIRDEEHGLASGGMNYFGGFALKGSDIYSAEREIVLGLRNSNNKQFSASICLGNRMMVCENLCFSSDVKLSRWHTTHIMRDLPRVIADAVSRVVTSWNDMEKRIESYKQTEITNRFAENLVVDLADVDGLSPRDIYPIIKEFRNPRHDDFKGNTLWNLYNSVTENLKGSNFTKLPRRTMVMQSMFDRVANPVLVEV
jgi:hypothetical protein